MWCPYISQRYCYWGYNFYFNDCRTQIFILPCSISYCVSYYMWRSCCKWWVLELVNVWIDASTCFSQKNKPSNHLETCLLASVLDAWLLVSKLEQSCIDIQILPKKGEKKEKRKRQTGVDLYALPRGTCFSHNSPTKCLPMLMSQLYHLPHNALWTI